MEMHWVYVLVSVAMWAGYELGLLVAYLMVRSGKR